MCPVPWNTAPSITLHTYLIRNARRSATPLLLQSAAMIERSQRWAAVFAVVLMAGLALGGMVMLETVHSNSRGVAGARAVGPTLSVSACERVCMCACVHVCALCAYVCAYPIKSKSILAAAATRWCVLKLDVQVPRRCLS
jgi:hypothetical protein